MIENVGGATIITGGHIQWASLVALKHGLEFEKKTGMKVSRVSALQVAKRRLGIASRKRLTYDKAIEEISKLMDIAKIAAEAQDAESPN